jgi:hypothetical protein
VCYNLVQFEVKLAIANWLANCPLGFAKPSCGGNDNYRGTCCFSKLQTQHLQLLFEALNDSACSWGWGSHNWMQISKDLRGGCSFCLHLISADRETSNNHLKPVSRKLHFIIKALIRTLYRNVFSPTPPSSPPYSFLPLIFHSNQLPNHKVLLTKPLLPPLQRLHLVRPQPLQLIKRSLQILRQHLLIKTPTRQSSTRVSPREILIRASWAVEIPTRCDVEDSSADGEVDGHVVCAVVREQGGRGEGSEYDGWGRGGEGDFGLGFELRVED